MGRQHSISPDTLSRFELNTATKEERALVVRHLLANCPACHQHLRERSHSVVLCKDRVYERAIERSLERAYHQAWDSAEANSLFTELKTHPHYRQETLARNHPRFRSIPLCGLLLDESDTARKKNPKEALRLAHLAQVVTSQLEGSGVQEYRVRAWAKVGNLLRLQGEFFAAEQALEEARTYLSREPGDKRLEAHLSSLWASLRFDQRRFEESIQFSQEYGRIFRELGSPHEAGRALVQEAIALIESGRPERATYLLVEAGGMVEIEREPALVLMIGHNIARSYADAGKPREALRIYIELRDLYSRLQDTSIQLKGLWLEGQILADMGHTESSISLLRKVHCDFLELGMTYEAALVALDLAATLAKVGQFPALAETVQQALPVFRALGVDREVAASFILLSKAGTGSSLGSQAT